jgi:hypothetical protein
MLLLVAVLSVVVGVLVTSGLAQATARSSDDDCATRAAQALLSRYSGIWNDGYLGYADPLTRPRIPCTADGRPLSLGPPFGVYELIPGQLLPPSLWRPGYPCQWWDSQCFAGYDRCGVSGPYGCPDLMNPRPLTQTADPMNPYVVQPIYQFSPQPNLSPGPGMPPVVTTPNDNWAPVVMPSPAPAAEPAPPAPVMAPAPVVAPTLPGHVEPSSPSQVQLPSLPNLDQSDSSSQSGSSSSQSGPIEVPGQSGSSGQSDSSGQEAQSPSQPELPQVQSVDPGSGSSPGASPLGSVLSGQ